MLFELARVFLKLGVIGFGGPAAHVALMRQEVVERRGWLTEAQFLEYLAASHLLPGPTSTELAIHVGQERAGWRGLIVAGACFIVPAALIVSVVAWGYVRFGTMPAAEGVLYGVKPVVIAVVLQALWSLGRTAVKSGWLAVIAAASLVALALGAQELTVLLVAGLICGAVEIRPSRDRGGVAGLAALAFLVPAAAAPVTPLGLFGAFLKIGSVLFGSGYVLLAFLQSELVDRLGWLTERQLLDAVAIGQITPGPVFTTATFVGYLAAGAPGALAATLGIFLPSFLFVALSGRLLRWVRTSAPARAALDGVTVASLALMAYVTVELARSALVDGLTIAIALVSALLLVRYRVNAAWLILAGAVLGLL
ncbi:MAG: chromate efflux transporter [Gemmatimonadetes bacterium]|nr:chromate efflux transporter [Gemmatimonadota bacterium]